MATLPLIAWPLAAGAASILSSIFAVDAAAKKLATLAIPVDRLTKLDALFEAGHEGQRDRLVASIEKSSVTLTLIPAAIVAAIAGTPAGVPGILIIKSGRSTAAIAAPPRRWSRSVSLAR